MRYGSIGGLEYEVPQSDCIVCVSTWLFARRPCNVFVVCDTKKFHDNESTHILHNFWTSTHRGEASPFPLPGGATVDRRQVGTSSCSVEADLSLRRCGMSATHANDAAK